MKRIKEFLKDTIRFRKLFAEMVEGGISDEIVGWHKAKWILNSENGVLKVSQYRYYLFIDLWIVKLRFSWLYPFKLKQKYG